MLLSRQIWTARKETLTATPAFPIFAINFPFAILDIVYQATILLTRKSITYSLGAT